MRLFVDVLAMAAKILKMNGIAGLLLRNKLKDPANDVSEIAHRKMEGDRVSDC